MSKRKSEAGTKKKSAAKKKELEDMEKRLVGDEEDEENEEPQKKKPRKLWKHDQPLKLFKCEPAEPTANGPTLPKIVFGKIPGSNLEDKEIVTFPIFLAHPNEEKGEDGNWPVQPIKFSFTGKHPVTEPTQFKGKGKKIDPLKDWTTNMSIDPSNARHAQIVKHVKTIHDTIAKELSSLDFWRTIGRVEYAMDEEALRTKGKSPIFDDPYEGSKLRIKFQYHPFSKSKLFELFDMRPVKEGKNKGKLNKNQIAPSLVHDGDLMDGCIEVGQVYLNPSEQTWGWSVRWTCGRVWESKGNTGDMNDEDRYKRSSKWLDEEAEEVSDEAAKMEEDEAEEEEEEEGDE